MAVVEPKPAATLLALRETRTEHGNELQTIMVVRHRKIDFASGALVFPGGKVAAEDNSENMRKLCANHAQFNDTELGYRIAAIRETFEESGLLFAYPENDTNYITEEIQSQYQQYREGINENKISMLDFLLEENLTLAVDQLIPFAHWITPEMVPKRYDTHFFVAKAPDAQSASPDGSESVEAIWINPNDAIKQGDEGKLTVIFPTRMNLQKLGSHSSVEEAIEQTKQQKIITVLPWTEMIDNKAYICIPDDAGYEESKMAVEMVPRG